MPERRSGGDSSTAIHPLRDDALANTSYLVEVGDGHAVTIDPPRDVDRHLALAERLGVQIVATLDTHVHADFVSGATELASHGADAIVPSGSTPRWPHRTIDADEPLAVGDVELRAIPTPGHTPEHVAYAVEVRGRTEAVFTGGSLILGGAARTDLLGAEHTEALARAQFGSLRRLTTLPDATTLHPTHGAGSFCLATAVDDANPTMGSERATNPLLQIDDEDAFVGALTGGFGSFPTYYRHLQALNESGPMPVAALADPPLLSPEVVAARTATGAWLVDARPTHEWAIAHPAGAVSIELRPAFASWLGWAVPFGAPVILILAEERREEAVRLSRRVGYDDLAFLAGGMDAWLGAGLPTGTVEEIGPVEARERQRSGVVLVDVRQDAELASARIPGAVHLELGDVIAGATPRAPEIVTFCGHGERSATAASLLERRGFRVANLVGGMSGWFDAELPVER
ncbi:MAG: MBL fold metallo-hydrolase [Acidimicrobiia bacterium]